MVVTHHHRSLELPMPGRSSVHAPGSPSRSPDSHARFSPRLEADEWENNEYEGMGIDACDDSEAQEIFQQAVRREAEEQAQAEAELEAEEEEVALAAMQTGGAELPSLLRELLKVLTGPLDAP